MPENHTPQMSELFRQEDFAGPQHQRITELLFEAQVTRPKRKSQLGTVATPKLSNAHILEAVALFYDLLPEGWVDLMGEFGRVAIAFMPLKCWPHGDPAKFETSAARFGRAELLCEFCSYDYWELELGPRTGKYLMPISEIPQAVRALCEAAASELGREPLFTGPTP